MKRILFFFFFGFLFAGCSKHAPYYYTISGLQLYNEDNSGPTPVDAISNDIPAKAYAIRLEFTNQLKDTTKNQDSESQYKLLYPAQTFTVTSLTDFDSLHPAGSNLNNYFLYGAYFRQVSIADSIPAQIARGWIGIGGSGWTRPVREPWTSSDHLVLMHPPAFFGNRSFVIHIVFADNTHFTDTITVNLLP